MFIVMPSMLHGNISFVLFQYLLWGVGDIPLAYRRRFLRGAAMFDKQIWDRANREQRTVKFFILYYKCALYYIIYIIYI